MRGDHPADPTANYHGGNRESVEAHESIAPRKRILRTQVVAYVAGREFAGGATVDEIEQGLGLTHQTVSARVTEAKARGELVPTGYRRKTRSGRYAAVLKAPTN